MSSPTITKVGVRLVQASISMHLPVKGLIKKTIFKHFCGGETMEDAAVTANILAQYGVGIILDYGVEGKDNEVEYDKAVPEFIKAIKYAATQKNIPFISLKVTGFARFALLEKVHACETLTADETKEFERIKQRVYDICQAAAQNHVMVLIDAEDSWIQQPVDDITDAMMEQFNKKEVIVYNTFQMYRHDRLEFLKKSYETAQAKNYLFGAKLVRGAYMENERKRAIEKGYPSPIYDDKESTDKAYDDATLFCLQHLDGLHLFIGTHNEQSCLKAAKYMQENKIPLDSNKVYFSQLFGMSDNISFNLAHEGYQVAKYLPYGPVLDVVPYLLRRAEENTSVAGQTSRELSLIEKEVKRRKL
ncbi:MAG: proline dehydrogenase family protein [Bacteroidota bacterium]